MHPTALTPLYRTRSRILSSSQALTHPHCINPDIAKHTGCCCFSHCCRQAPRSPGMGVAVMDAEISSAHHPPHRHTSPGFASRTTSTRTRWHLGSIIPWASSHHASRKLERAVINTGFALLQNWHRSAVATPHCQPTARFTQPGSQRGAGRQWGASSGLQAVRGVRDAGSRV